MGASSDKSQVFILRKDIPGADAVRSSYDTALYKRDPNETGAFKYAWAGGMAPFTRTIYNPLDGGVLLQYTQKGQPTNSDGCSGGGEPGQTVFQDACFGHDANYDAPFDKEAFPQYSSGASTGQELADYLFLKDMLVIVKQLTKERSQWAQNLWETTAFAFYRGATDWGKYRGGRADQEVLAKGGIVAVKNKGNYTMGMRVKWTAPQGERKVEEILNHGGRAAVIPLSVGAKDIEIECWAVGGVQIFKKTFADSEDSNRGCHRAISAIESQQP
jgi:hypothetical protein